MSAAHILLLACYVLGGLGLFMYGMKMVTESFQAISAGRIRDLVLRLTRGRVLGLGAGTLLGFILHSSPAVCLLATLVGAGMLTLRTAIPVVLGANVGTTLSMQVISLQVGKYALAPIALGVVLHLAVSRLVWKRVGGVLLGFGLIYLGMDVMGAAAAPIKESGALLTLLRVTQDYGFRGYFTALVISTVATGIIQSSGATIGLIFALCYAGVFTDLRQVFPLVVGAHIGTCVTALLGTLGMNIEARRSAYAHLAFNALGAVLASIMLPLYLRIIPLVSTDLTRQVANTHSLVQIANAVLLLPFTSLFQAAIRRVSPSRERPPEPSHLDHSALQTPEKAIAGAMRETRRMAVIARQMLVQAMSGMLRCTDKPFARVTASENVVDALRRAVDAYLLQIAERKLSTRQSILLQHLMVTTSDLERIADHVETVVETTRERVAQGIWFDDESMHLLVGQYVLVDRLLRLTILSLDPDLSAFREISQRTLALRRQHVQNNRALRSRYRQRILNHQATPLSGLFYERYLRSFDRIVRHTKSIARVEKDEAFLVKPQRYEDRIERASIPVDEERVPIPVDERILCEELTFDDLGVQLSGVGDASSDRPSR